MVFKWNRNLDDIARLIPKNSIRGVFKKDVLLQPNEEAVLLQEGTIKDVLTRGKIRMGGVLKPANYLKDTDIILIDRSLKEVRWRLDELWTLDTQKIGCEGIIRFRISDPKRLFTMLFTYTTPDKSGERNLTTHDLYEHIQSEVLTRVLQPVIGKTPVENLYGNLRLQQELENQLDLQLKDTMQTWGFELQKLATEWDFKDYIKVLNATHEQQITEELEELKTTATEGKIESDERIRLARIKAYHSTISIQKDFERGQKLRDAKTRSEIAQIESESDSKELEIAMKTKEEWDKIRINRRRAEIELDHDASEKEHKHDLERLNLLTEKGGAEAARIIAEGREYSGLSPAQLEAIAKMREGEARAKEDKITFIKEIEDREREDAYRRQELDANLMNAAKPATTGANVRKCPNCGATVPMQASFCKECGGKLE